MFEDIALFLLWLTLAAFAFWMTPPRLALWRQLWLIASSFVLVFAAAPWAALYVAWMWLWSALAVRAFAVARRPAVLAAFLLAVCWPLLLQRTVSLDAGLIATLGITFATLRAVAVVIDGYVTREIARPGDIGLCLFFLPLYTVGPIESVRKFAREQLARAPAPAFMARGLSRMALGLFKTVLVAEVIIAGQIESRFPLASRSFEALGSAEVAAFVLLSFLYTYVNFSGVVDIALGASRLFGLDIIENFDYPVLARNLRDFWKRWHISLGRWITQYLYFPVVAKLRTPVSPYVATFTAFVLIGWWHGSTINYLCWGVFHGAGLCTVMFWQRRMRARHSAAYAALARHPLYVGGCWAVTVLYVSWVQTFANQRSFAEAVAMTRALVGM